MEHNWGEILLNYLHAMQNDDAAHDIGHFQRVAFTANQIAQLEKEPTDALVILAAAYFHDLVNLPKNHPESKFASRYSAQKAKDILVALKFPQEKIESVCHAIEAHSFSAQLQPQTLEAKIIQDADRMEALGALGIMRTFYVAGRIGSLPYHPVDPFALERILDDKAFALDHFYCKLFKLPDLLQTAGGHEIALKRVDFLHVFIKELLFDLEKKNGGALLIVTTCYKAGIQKQKLFHLNDAFAEHRPLQREDFVIDKLIASTTYDQKFIPVFLSQAKEEIVI